MSPLLIIDPGHGGLDPGGGSNAKFKEKDMTLQISLYQSRRFQELNIPTVMTRTTDTTLSSEQRTAIVRSSGARYCISNHINSGGGHGAEAIYSIYSQATLAKHLIEELEIAGMPARRVYTRTYPGNPKLDYYFMHRETGSVETVILEYGFADNPVDAGMLETDWEKLAEAVVRGFTEFVGKEYKPPVPAQPAEPVPVHWNSLPAWKREGVDWLYAQGLLTDQEWRGRIDEPLPLWAEAAVLKRLYGKLSNGRQS
ncbi:N-acetylmuramoyl-L-alanine amidase [Brevibacillus massiliensis]|uniref:N-acetylmuramoyl-L-alanine amidase n=1 Tax=Brevibacillus massiliensis TaxID=1118054 RepID=UPI0002FC7DE1|nr:N-acetylmuramoyl-L-alanine amidase [Brevibacillus massiliensis]